jgi:prepilin signal peptidase PulO-like enzyme (type II secretory pathway)
LLIEFIIFCIGLIFGSFVTCASYRLPLGIDIVKKPSYCPNCETKLGFRDLWPVLSWLLSGGKCRHCGAGISPRYPLIELITGALFLFIYTRYGLIPQSFILMAAAVVLMIMIVADLEHFIIPDFVHIALLPLAFAYRYASGTFSGDILWGFGLMAGFALLLHYGYSRLRGRVMLGFGDVKFFAVAGVWLDISAIPAFLLIAGVLGIVFGLIWRLAGRGQIFPFGPALAVSLLFCLIYPEAANLMFL